MGVLGRRSLHGLRPAGGRLTATARPSFSLKLFAAGLVASLVLGMWEMILEDAEGRLRFAYLSVDPMDRPPVSTLLAALRRIAAMGAAKV